MRSPTEKMIRLAAVGAFGLVACATTPGKLAVPENRSAATVDVPYQLALKRIVDFSRECAGSPLLPVGETINDVDHYPDLREAKITKGASGVGTQIYQVIEIREHTAEAAHVILYAKLRRDDWLQRLVKWAEGDSGCKL